MTKKLEQIIKEELAKLQKDTQNAINSLDWTKICEETGKNNLLTESEINNLQTETLLVLIGLVGTDEYKLNIENEIGLSREEAGKIAEEIEQKIFKLIYENLTEKIKDNIKTKNPNWKQTLNFILSGGDYSAFLETVENTDIQNNTIKTDTKINL